MLLGGGFAALLPVVLPAPAQAGSFQGIGVVEAEGAPEAGRSIVQGISGDGSTVVGSISGEGFSTVDQFRWTGDEGLDVLPRAPAQLNGPFISVGARAASFDGSVIGGGWRLEPRIWTEETGTLTTALDGGSGWVPNAGINAMSSDGRTIGGWSGPNGTRPWYYSEDTGYINLSIPGIQLGPLGSLNALSANGEYAFGEISDRRNASDPDVISNPGDYRVERAFRWSVDGGLEILSELGDTAGRARAASADGSIAVGQFGAEAALWDIDASLTIMLGGLNSGPDPSSNALDVTGDGSVVVGSSGGKAFIWDAEAGIQDLNELLANEYNLDLAGWTLTNATAISADGKVIAGNGINPDGIREGWVAVVPEPSAGLLLGLGLGVLGASRQRI